MNTLKIFELCREKRLFEGGFVSQYDKMLSMCSRKDFTERDISIAIWLCTPNKSIEEIEILVHDTLKEGE